MIRRDLNKRRNFFPLKAYIIQQLTGEYVIDYSLASATGLLNIHTIKWEPEALKYAGITAINCLILFLFFIRRTN